jgi:CBS domain-containing protein
MKISEVLDKIENLPYLALPEDLTLDEVAQKVTGFRRLRQIYIIDSQGRLQGALTLGALIRLLLQTRNKPVFHTRSLLSRLTTERVADVMDRQVIYTRPTDDVAQVLDRMVHHNIKEIPVVDAERRIIANLSLLDLWNLAGS